MTGYSLVKGIFYFPLLRFTKEFNVISPFIPGWAVTLMHKRFKLPTSLGEFGIIEFFPTER